MPQGSSLSNPPDATRAAIDLAGALSFQPRYSSRMSDIVPSEGQGGSPLFKDPHHIREDLRTLTAALRAGWNVPDDVRKDALAVAAGIMREGGTDRDRIAAVRLLVQMRKDDVEALALLDKIGRLETGEATERIELKPITFERRD